MAKTSREKNKIIITAVAVLAISIIIFFLTNYKSLNNNQSDISSVNRTYYSSGLNFSFKYPEGWIISELGGRSLQITEPKGNSIKILITKTPMLQGQSMSDYLAAIDYRSGDSSKIILTEDIRVANKNAIRRVIEPTVGNNLNQYVIILIDNNNFVYSISATPADSELIPVFEEIVRSIKFN